MRWVAVAGVVIGCGSAGSSGPDPAEKPEQIARPGGERADSGATSIDAGPAPLEAWPIPENAPARERSVELYARDADAQMLMFQLADSYLDVKRSIRVSGKASGPRDSVRAALVAQYPGLGQGTNPAIGGRARRVDFQFDGADAANIYRLLADVLGLSIVLPPRELPSIYIRVTNAPSDGVMKLLNARLNLTLTRQGSVVFLVPDDQRVDRGLLETPGKALDLQVRGAPAGAVIAMIERVTRVPRTAACDAGEPIEQLRLRNARVGAVLAAVAFTSTASLSKGKPRCDVAVLSAKDDTEGAELLAIARRGGKSAALLRLAGGELRLYAGKGIASGAVRLRNKQDLELYPPDSEDEADSRPWHERHLGELRLAATIHGADKRALVETDEEMAWLREDQAAIDHESIQIGDRTLMLSVR